MKDVFDELIKSMPIGKLEKNVKEFSEMLQLLAVKTVFDYKNCKKLVNLIGQFNEILKEFDKEIEGEKDGRK